MNNPKSDWPAPILRRLVREAVLFLGSLLGPDDALYQRVVRVAQAGDPALSWICIRYAFDVALPPGGAADWIAVHLAAARADWTVARPRCRRLCSA